jgi:MFS family permease
MLPPHYRFDPFIDQNGRISAFFSTASLSGAFSGILAYGIINMNGIGNRPGWAWIFILEGLFTVLFGVASFFLLPRTPAHARFLSEKEKAYVVAHLREDGATADTEDLDRFSWREVGQAFTLPQVWMLAIIFFFDGEQIFLVVMEVNPLNTRSCRDGPLRSRLVCRSCSAISVLRI